MELFISYCHKDEDYAESFQKILSPLVGEGKALSNIWYDRKINVGEEFWDKIDSHLDDSDVICLLLSSDYLSSNSCKKEMNRALERHEKDHVLVIPVVLRPCGWVDEDNRLSKLLGTPKDGKAISTFDNKDELKHLLSYIESKMRLSLLKLINYFWMTQQFFQKPILTKPLYCYQIFLSIQM